jgi:integrase
MPHREQVEHDDHEEVRALSREQLAALIAVAPAGHRLLLELMVSTGLLVSEAIALQRRHLHLDGERPHVRVRHALVRGSYVPPKTKHGRRTSRCPRAS